MSKLDESQRDRINTWLIRGIAALTFSMLLSTYLGVVLLIEWRGMADYAEAFATIGMAGGFVFLACMVIAAAEVFNGEILDRLEEMTDSEPEAEK